MLKIRNFLKRLKAAKNRTTEAEKKIEKTEHKDRLSVCDRTEQNN